MSITPEIESAAQRVAEAMDAYIESRSDDDGDALRERLITAACLIIPEAGEPLISVQEFYALAESKRAANRR